MRNSKGITYSKVPLLLSPMKPVHAVRHYVEDYIRKRFVGNMRIRDKFYTESTRASSLWLETDEIEYLEESKFGSISRPTLMACHLFVIT